MKDKFRYWWTILYLPVYLLFFGYVEARPVDVTIIGLPIDYQIPLIEAFVIPYLLWFPYIAVTFVWFFFCDKKEFLQYMGFLYIGMTIFIIVSLFFPNGLDIRPETFARDNCFTKTLAVLYQTDTSTNVIPSIHVYNSIAAAVAMVKSRHVSPKLWQKIFAVVMSALIILSTVFVKQHSVIDVMAACIVSIIVYIMIYWYPDRHKRAEI